MASQDILKGKTQSLTAERPKGLQTVLAGHASGFWGKLEDEAAYPNFTIDQLPRIFTFEPWLGCLWGKSCQFCYVPRAGLRFYPDGKRSYWFNEWGSWLLYKDDIVDRLRDTLLDARGRTRPGYRGAAIFMSSKTDPFLPLEETLSLTCEVLDIIEGADVFLMCQTRSPKVVEDGRLLTRLKALASQGKVGVSFSLSTDRLDQQKLIERAGLMPQQRLAVMAQLKHEGIFVSAAVSPLMPFSPDFARCLLKCSHHASIQLAKPSGSGAATPEGLFAAIRSIPGYSELDKRLSDDLRASPGVDCYAWGINNKGFMGAFLAARRFYCR